MDEVHLALYGSDRGAHSLLEHTGANPELLGRAMWHTDGPPQGDIEDLGGFHAGYELDDHYVVQWTVPDLEALRPGMVKTSALFLPIEFLPRVSLSSAFSALRGAFPDGPMPLSSLKQVDPEVHAHPVGAHALVDEVVRSRKAVWVGSGLDDRLACIWRHVSPGDRRRLVFGGAFHPAAVSVPTGASSLTVLRVPERYLTRWADWPTVSSNSQPRSPDVAAAILDHGNGSVVEGLAGDLLVEGVRLEQWPRVVALVGLIDNLATISHENARAALQLLGLLAPAAEVGVDLKNALLDRLEMLTPDMPFSDVRGLKSVPWQALETGPRLSGMLRSWSHRAVTEPSMVGELGEAIREVSDSGQSPFGRSLAGELRAAITENHRQAAKQAVGLVDLADGESLLQWISENGPAESFDRAISDYFTPSGPAAPAWLPGFAIKRRWARTHACTVPLGSSLAAWKAQIRVGPDDEEALDLLVSRAGAPALVAVALKLDSPLLTAAASARVAEEPSLLSGDVTDAAFRRVWVGAMQLGCDPWAVVAPHAAGGRLLDLVTSGEDVDLEILSALANTEEANLSDRADRPTLWQLLQGDVRERMLAATADALVRKIGAADPAPEPPLASAMLEPMLLGTLAHDDPEQAVLVLGLVPGARSQHAATVVRRGKFPRAVGEALADLILRRRWKSAAEVVLDLAGDRPDLAAVAPRLLNLFGVLERLRRAVGISGAARVVATHDELRDALHELVAELYPDGPKDSAVWERSGGDPADIPEATTGRNGWGRALKAMDDSRRGAPTLAALLKTMKKDFPRNQSVADLRAVLREREEL